MEKKLKILVLGLGNFGKSWVESVVSACSDITELVGAVDEDVNKHIERIPCFTKLEEAVSCTMPELVINVTPPHVHNEVNKWLMERNISVLCEKPIASNYEEAKVMQSFAKQSPSFLMIGENYRYSEMFRYCRRLIENNNFGRIHMIECRFRHFHLDYSMYYHGKLEHPLLTDVAIHHLDVARYLTGEEPVSVWAEEYSAPYSWYKERPATALILTTMTGNIRFNYFGTLASPESTTDWSGDWEIECDHGIICIQNGSIFTYENGSKNYHKVKKEDDSRIAELREAVNAIKEGRKAETDILDNFKTYQWLEAAIQSAQCSNKEIINISQLT